MFGILQSECGYTPDEIDAMTMHDCQRLFNHWRRNPPLRELVRAVAVALGIEFKNPDDKPKYLTGEEAMAMMRLTHGKIDGIGSM